MKKRIYLDHNATTPVHPEVLSRMLPYFSEKFGNPSSLHSLGQEAHLAMDTARNQVAKLIGARADEIIFLSGGTESDNLAIQGVAFANRDKGNHIITSSIEHHAVLNTCKFLEKQGFQVTYLPVDSYGIVDLEALRQAITDKTILITIMHVNNEVGTIQPIEEIGKIARERNIYFHTDAVQSVGKIPVNVKELNVDLLSLSAHKFYGPKGIGALYIKKGVKIQPIIYGGHHERDKRAGTENLPGIVGLGAACEIAMKEMEEKNKHLLMLSEKFYNLVRERIPDIKLNGHPEKRIPGTVNISFAGIEGESILLSLDFEGIEVSTGSACASASLEPSHVLIAMGVPPEIAHGTIRFSFGYTNTIEEVEYTVDVLEKVVKRLRDMSPLKDQIKI